MSSPRAKASMILAGLDLDEVRRCAVRLQQTLAAIGWDVDVHAADGRLLLPGVAAHGVPTVGHAKITVMTEEQAEKCNARESNIDAG